MNQYITGTIIKKLREERKMTQLELAGKLNVSEKTISKWENAKGYPDVGILEDLAAALGISVIELMAGNDIRNNNRSFNMTKLKFYVCPICGNVIWAVGEAVISCCGVVLPALDAEETDEMHGLDIEEAEDEYFVTCSHEMSKSHYISFAAAVKDNCVEIVKLYPEGNAECRFKINRTKYLYFYCNRHGLYKVMLHRKRKKRE